MDKNSGKSNPSVGLDISGDDNIIENNKFENIDTAIILRKPAKRNKVINNDIINIAISKPPIKSKDVWYKKPLGSVFLSVTSGLIIFVVTHLKSLSKLLLK